MNVHARVRKPVERNQRKLAKARSHEILLLTAKREFIEHGYHGTTLRDIAKAAGYSTGMIYSHVVQKAELFVAVLDDDWNDSQPQIIAMADSLLGVDADPADALATLYGLEYNYQIEQLELLREKLALWWSGERRVVIHMTWVQNQMQRYSEKVLAQAIESGRLSSMKVDLISGMIWDMYIGLYQKALADTSETSITAGRLTALLKERIAIILADYRIELVKDFT